MKLDQDWGYIGVHGHGCCGPCYRNPFGVQYCSWCGQIIEALRAVVSQ